MSSDRTVNGKVKQGPGVLFRHLRSGEKVLWSGKPVKLAFLFSTTAGLFGLLAISFLFILWCSLSIVMGKVLSIVDFTFVVIMLIFLGSPIWQLMRYRNTEYMITNQRLITQTGAIGLDTRFVDLDKIQEVYVQVGVTDKMLGTGSVIAVTAGFVPVGATAKGGLARPSLAALKEPYKVQKILQEALP